jgi:predicted RNA-binding Zn-ribbon protein involved in translation (DUF1610 family)
MWSFVALAVLGGVLAIAVVLLDVASRRRSRQSQRLLASLACPACGAPFGSAAAIAAFNPPPQPEYLIDDDFGYASVTCPECGAMALFHREKRELVKEGLPN